MGRIFCSLPKYGFFSILTTAGKLFRPLFLLPLPPTTSPTTASTSPPSSTTPSPTTTSTSPPSSTTASSPLPKAYFPMVMTRIVPSPSSLPTSYSMPYYLCSIWR